MGDAKESEKNEKESPPLQSGTFNTLHHLHCWPLTGRSLQDPLRSFFQPIKTDDPRVDFYMMYKREATEYDMDYVKKYDRPQYHADFRGSLIMHHRSS